MSELRTVELRLEVYRALLTSAEQLRLLIALCKKMESWEFEKVLAALNIKESEEV